MNHSEAILISRFYFIFESISLSSKLLGFKISKWLGQYLTVPFHSFLLFVMFHKQNQSWQQLPWLSAAAILALLFQNYTK